MVEPFELVVCVRRQNAYRWQLVVLVGCVRVDLLGRILVDVGTGLKVVSDRLDLLLDRGIELL